MTTEPLEVPADGPLDAVDAQVLAGVREVYDRTDPMPPELPDRIKFELTLAALHAEVAQLQELTLTGVRADPQPIRPTESVTFTSSRYSLMVTVSAGGDGAAAQTVRIDGWVTGGPASIEVRVGGVSRTTRTDAGGRFVLDGVPRGSARFVLRPDAPDDQPVITPAIEV